MNKSQLEKKISEKEHQILKLRESIDLSPICAELYNKAILEKAVLKKELNELTRPIIAKITCRLKSVLPFKEKKICDYFKG